MTKRTVERIVGINMGKKRSFTSVKEIQELNALSPFCYVLMSLYASLIFSKGAEADIKDATLAKILEVSEKTIASTRRKLEKAGWIEFDRTTKQGKVMEIISVGKEAVKG